MLRKVLTSVAVLLLFAMLVTACGGKGQSAAPGAIKHGMGSVTLLTESIDAGESDGLVQVDSTVATVVLDSEGKIVSVAIEAIQSKMPFTADGKLAGDPSVPTRTKKELGDEYGMKKASSLNKEWFEQIDALEKWLVGKTLSDIENMKLTDGAADDLKTSVTMTVTNYLEAVKKAIANAK
jgi:hypothetical protein